MEEKGLTVADALALRGVGQNNNDNGLGGFGGAGAWWVIILILFLMGGIGRGYGNGGGDSTNTVFIPTGGTSFGGGSGWNNCCTPATAQGLTDAFNFNSLDNNLRATHEAVTNGFYSNNLATTNLGTAMQSSFGSAALQNCQGFNNVIQSVNGLNNSINGVNNTVNQGVNSIQSTLCNGFNNVQSALANTNFNMQNCCCETRESIMQSNFNNQTGFNTLGTAIATNACNIERGQDDIRYLMAQNQNQTIAAIDHVGDRLIDYMNNNKMEELRTELQNAKFQISQAAQTDAIINQLQPVARPAWLVNSPYQSLNYNGVNACGCGNF